MMWWWVAMALASGRAEVRADLEAGRFEEAMGTCRAELLLHPDRGWAQRGLTAASEALAQRAVSSARAAYRDGRVADGEAALERARSVLARAASSGAAVDPQRVDGLREELVQSAADHLRRVGDAAQAAGDMPRAVDRYEAARALVPDDGVRLVAAWRQWSGQLQARGDLAGAAAKREAAAVLSGDPADREAAAALHAERGAALRAVDDCRGATEALRAAAHLDRRHEPALEGARACARVEVGLTVRGDADAPTAALRQAVVEALGARATEHLVPVRGEAAYSLTVELRSVTSETGDVTSRTVRKGRGGAVLLVIEAREAPVTVHWQGRMVLRHDEVVWSEAPLEAEATSLARWESRPKGVEFGPIRRPGQKGPSGEKQPALAAARAEAEAAVARAWAAAVADWGVPQLDPPTPPPPGDGHP